MPERTYQEIFNSQMPVPQGARKALLAGGSDEQIGALLLALAEEPERLSGSEAQSKLRDAARSLAGRDEASWPRWEFAFARLGVSCKRRLFSAARRRAALSGMKAWILAGETEPDISAICLRLDQAGEANLLGQLYRQREKLIAGMPPAYRQICALAARRAGLEADNAALAELLDKHQWFELFEIDGDVIDVEQLELDWSRATRAKIAALSG